MTALSRLHKVETRLEELRAELDRQRRTILKSSNSDSAPEALDDATSDCGAVRRASWLQHHKTASKGLKRTPNRV